MRIAHLILTATDPAQTDRMMRKLYHDKFDFYIHVDRKLDINPYLHLKGLPNVYFINDRIRISEAGSSTLKAIFSCIKEIVSTSRHYQFINFLTSEDYPIKSPGFIYEFLMQNAGKEFMSFRDIRNDWKEGLIRMERYFLPGNHYPGKYRLEILINKILPKRSFPYGLHPYGKSMFWMLSPEAAMFVVNKVSNDKKLKKFISMCWTSEEFIFQTILLNSSYLSNIINNNYRYSDRPDGTPDERILTKNDIEILAGSEMLFARKFDAVAHPEILDLIDQVLLSSDRVISEGSF